MGIAPEQEIDLVAWLGRRAEPAETVLRPDAHAAVTVWIDVFGARISQYDGGVEPGRQAVPHNYDKGNGDGACCCDSRKAEDGCSSEALRRAMAKWPLDDRPGEHRQDKRGSDGGERQAVGQMNAVLIEPQKGQHWPMPKIERIRNKSDKYQGCTRQEPASKAVSLCAGHDQCGGTQAWQQSRD